MTSYKVDLDPFRKQSKYYPYFFSVIGLVYIIIGILNLERNDDYSFQGWIWILGGIIFIISTFYHKKYRSKYFIEINNSFIQAKQSITRNIRISWSELKVINVNPISIEFLLFDGKKENISLGNVGYQNVLDIKSKLLEFAKHKKVPIN